MPLSQWRKRRETRILYSHLDSSSAQRACSVRRLLGRRDSIDTHLDPVHAYLFATSNYLHKMKIGEKIKIHCQKKGHNLATEISQAS
ncbi:hypothetical protein A6U87_05770 [Rhizobium sp. AC44/96]|nr:hypothetical protein A6U87_05770 [Rhizobium sp. AC44/96]